ncbi:hypothetical protein DXG01_012570 [Tephrocybe rancida]|nr:hypothetical protein DXG01_012570 [Tephrocybe rancida]
MILAIDLDQLLAQDLLVEPSSSNTIPAPSSNDRSISGIVWSCLITIFACTWIAVHPNIPRPNERPIFRRLKIVALALIAPEIIVLWALRQWVSSRSLARKYRGASNAYHHEGMILDPDMFFSGFHQEFGWTQTHGFFVIMGGFHVREPGGTSFTLDSEDIRPYLDNHDINISEKAIQDRSKGDALSKCLVLTQVTWFVLQVLARAVQHLAITELEIVTLAFTVLNFITYLCWWNKPLDVNDPIQLRSAYHTPGPTVEPAESRTLATQMTHLSFWDSPSSSSQSLEIIPGHFQGNTLSHIHEHGSYNTSTSLSGRRAPPEDSQPTFKGSGIGYPDTVPRSSQAGHISTLQPAPCSSDQINQVSTTGGHNHPAIISPLPPARVMSVSSGDNMTHALASSAVSIPRRAKHIVCPTGIHEGSNVHSVEKGLPKAHAMNQPSAPWFVVTWRTYIKPVLLKILTMLYGILRGVITTANAEYIRLWDGSDIWGYALSGMAFRVSHQA